jgi:cell division septum initiation protein DivIVA
VRGYDRGAVDAYRKRVNRVIAEMRVSGSPRAAVRHALEQAGEQVHGLLQSARETAEEITASARREAEESTARAEAEAAELVVSASAEADRVRAEANEFTATARTETEALVAKAGAESDGICASATTEAENISERSRMEADERLKQLEEKLALLRDDAETRMSEIQADTQGVWESAARPAGSSTWPRQRQRDSRGWSRPSPRRKRRPASLEIGHAAGLRRRSVHSRCDRGWGGSGRIRRERRQRIAAGLAWSLTERFFQSARRSHASSSSSQSAGGDRVQP